MHGPTKTIRREIADHLAAELTLPAEWTQHIRPYHRMPGNVDLPAVIIEADDDAGYHSFEPTPATFCGPTTALTAWLCLPDRSEDGDFDLLDDWGDAAYGLLDGVALDAGGQVSVRSINSPRPGVVGETPVKFIAIEFSVA